MKTMIAILSGFICLFIFTVRLSADCYYNGKAYPPGSKANGFVCGEDGQWREE